MVSIFKSIWHSPYTIWILLTLPSLRLVQDAVWPERYYPELMYESGLLAVQLMVVALTVTPLLRLSRDHTVLQSILRWVQKRRRAIGVAAFGYSALHTFFYIRYIGGLENALLDLTEIDIAIGWAAFVLLLILAATSNQWSVRALGSRWKRIQRLAYLAALLTALHWIWIGNFLDDLWWWSTPLAILQIARILHSQTARYLA